MNKREIFAVMVKVTANTLFAVRILHLHPRVVAKVFRKQSRDFFVTVQTFERWRACAELMAASALRRTTE
jgi:hypothetical protein